MKVHRCVEFETPLAPERVVEALVDFSAKRVETWRGLDPEKFRVCELGETYALIEEGNRTPDIWARERYDWSLPGTVSWATEASNAFAPGCAIHLAVVSSGAGSRVRIDATRVSATPIGSLVVLALKLMGHRFLLSNYKGTFDRLARSDRLTA